MKRWLFTIALTAALFFIVKQRFVLEDDPVRSLRAQDDHPARVFGRYHERSVFEGKVFVDFAGLAEADRKALEALLAEARYVPAAMFTPPGPQEMLALLPLMPAEQVAQALSDEAIAARADQALSFAMLPGGAGYLAQVEKDPFGLGTQFLQETLARLGFSGSDPARSQIRAFQSPAPIVYDDVGRVYDKLVSLGPAVHFIGGDFFAYENYKAAQRDVVVCSTLTLLINLLLFLFFTRRFKPLALLFLGSLVSYLTGVLAVGLVYDKISAVALAFTSTFVGFNNESLVHLSALPQGSKKKSLLAVWSALGTTVIGFVVLLLGHSILVRQMALASLGGMVGFLAVLLVFRGMLGEVRFRTFSWPKLSIGRRALAAVAGGAVVLLVLLPKPTVSTSISEFRSESPQLRAQTDYFNGKLGESNLKQVFAARVEGGVQETVERLEKEGRITTRAHPLLAWRTIGQQQETLGVLGNRYAQAVGKLNAALLEAGLTLELDAKIADRLRPLDAWSYLSRLNALAPAKWAEEVDGKRYVFVSGAPGVEGREGFVPMSPQHYYDSMLTGLSRELAMLFGLGLLAMCIYLAVLHRKPWRVLYVFVPLMLSGVFFLAYAALMGGRLNIIHFVGFSLVIALATDYASVAMSVDHHEVEMSKILLTALSTLGTFGVLLLAEHPVMRDLGWTVTIGCVVAAAVALFVKLRGEEASQPAAAEAETAEPREAA